MRRLIYAFLSLSLVGLMGCTEEKIESAAINIHLPKSIPKPSASSASAKITSSSVSAQSLNLSHAIINVSGPGIVDPVFMSWDGHRNGTLINPPSSFIVDVPNGDGRLFQALLVFYDNVSGAEEFYYGEVSQPVSKDTTSVTITVNPAAGTNNNVGDGQITGRYLNADGKGYTGRVRYKYAPPNGRPEMLVEIGEMFGGWMSHFGLENVPFNYVLDDGSSLFGGPKTLAEIPLANSQQNMRVRVPNHYYKEYGDGGSFTFMPAKSRMIIVGYFGPGASGKKICYPASDTNIGDGYSDNLGATPIQWNPAVNGSVLNGGWAWVDDPDGVASTYTRGGSQEAVDGTTGLCKPSTGTSYEDFLSLDHKSLVHHDGTLAFSGPYQSPYTDSTGWRRELDVNYSASILTINWMYLPGVYATDAPRGIEGSEVFYKILAVGESPDDIRDNAGDGILCGKLPAMGFVSLRDETIADTGVDYTTNIAISTGLPANFASNWSAGKVQIAVCPYATSPLGSRIYFKSGTYYAMYGGGGGGMNWATTFDVQAANNTASAKVANGVCAPIYLLGKNGANPASLPGDVNYTVSVTPTDANLSFYNDPSCASAALNIGSGFQLSGGGQHAMLFAKRVAADNSQVRSITVAGNNGGGGFNDSKVISMEFMDQSSLTLTKMIKTVAPASIYKYSCFPVRFEAWHSLAGVEVLVNFPASYGMEGAISSGMTYYSDNDPSCSGGANSYASLGSSTAVAYKFAKYTGVSGTVSVQAIEYMSGTSYVGSGGTYSGGASITVTQPGAITNLQLNMNSNLNVNVCQTVDVNYVDANGHLSPVLADKTVNLSTTVTGVFYSSPGCSAGVITTVGFLSSSADTTKRIYFKATSSTPGTGTVGANDGSLSSSLNINVAP